MRKRQLDREARKGNSTAKVSVYHDPANCYEALRTGSRALAYFSTEVDSGRDLFRLENYNKIRALAKTKSAATSQGSYTQHSCTQIQVTSPGFRKT